MPVTIKEVLDKKALKTFVKLPFALYKNDPLWVPQLIHDDMEIFNKDKNPAFENADSRLFLAYRDGKPVGRIAAIDSRVANQKYATKNLRFGWFDAIDDPEVAAALFGAVEGWAKELGHGDGHRAARLLRPRPAGHAGRGLRPAADHRRLLQFPLLPEAGRGPGLRQGDRLCRVPLPRCPRTCRPFPRSCCAWPTASRSAAACACSSSTTKRRSWRRAEELFHLLDEAFEEIYGAVPLTEKQVHYFIKKYFAFVDKDLIQVVVNDKDEMVGFMIAMPSLSRAFQKANGRLFPFGWWHILRALKKKRRPRLLPGRHHEDIPRPGRRPADGGADGARRRGQGLHASPRATRSWRPTPRSRRSGNISIRSSISGKGSSRKPCKGKREGREREE